MRPSMIHEEVRIPTNPHQSISGDVPPIDDVKRFRGGLAFKAHRLVYHSTLGLRVIKKKKMDRKHPGSDMKHPGSIAGALPPHAGDRYLADAWTLKPEPWSITKR